MKKVIIGIGSAALAAAVGTATAIIVKKNKKSNDTVDTEQEADTVAEDSQEN